MFYCTYSTHTHTHTHTHTRTVQGAQLGGGKHVITNEVKSEVLQLSGQNSELRSRLSQCEGELRSAVRLAERRECEVSPVKS